QLSRPNRYGPKNASIRWFVYAYDVPYCCVLIGCVLLSLYVSSRAVCSASCGTKNAVALAGDVPIDSVPIFSLSFSSCFVFFSVCVSTTYISVHVTRAILFYH
ncbi:unnamed protein product, partial [Ectocarpus sp. 12 AP-2014]